MILVVLSGFLGALMVPLLRRFALERAGWVIALLPMGLFVYFLQFLAGIGAGKAYLYSYPWVPSLGVRMSFHLDGLSFVFALLITGMAALVFIYTGAYLSGHAGIGRLYSFLLVFMGSMLGLVLADDVITLFMFWELTSVSSYMLIAYDHERESARQSALQALLTTGIGGLALLAGLLLMAMVGGSSDISILTVRRESILSSHLYMPILLLLLLGAFTKSAQFPFHYWLPNAMAAPAPVSAYLHSATMVKAGVYLLCRLTPIFNDTYAWGHILIPVGAATMLTGAYLAMLNTDLKLVLAYSTVSALGLLFLMLGIGTPEALQAVTVFLVAHALYKGALFLVVGAIDHETGTREADRLGGLYRVMPLTSIAAGLSALSSAGIPPLFGFIGKELTYKATFGEPIAHLLTTVVLLTNISFVVVAGLAGIQPFWGRGSELLRQPQRLSWGLCLGPLVLASISLAIGLFPDLIAKSIVSPSVAAMEQQPTAVELALWHGFHPALALSFIGFLLGVGLFWKLTRFRTAAVRQDLLLNWGPARWYAWMMVLFIGVARMQTRILQNGYLNIYLLVITFVSVGLVGAPLLGPDISFEVSRWWNAPVYELLLACIILLAAILIVKTSSRLTAVVSLGVVGYGVALLFLIFSAPDLAMTQFAIETLSIILLVLILLRLPAHRSHSSPLQRLRDVIPALMGGAVMTALVLASTAVSRESRLVPYFVEHSLSIAHGLNLVNVILVDFRGLDTLGEIVVLSIAALGVYAMLRLRIKPVHHNQE